MVFRKIWTLRMLGALMGLSFIWLMVWIKWTLVCSGKSDFGVVSSWRDTASRTQLAEGKEQEPLAEKQQDDLLPQSVIRTVHYIWCGEKRTFLFCDYLSVLSALRVLRPLKLVFHFTHMPVTDLYNSWFQMLNTSVPIMELQPLSPSIPCGSRAMLSAALQFLAPLGGVVMGQGVILSRAPSNWHQRLFTFHLSSSNLSGIIFANRGLDEEMREEYLDMMVSTPPSCVSEKSYNTRDQNAHCVTIKSLAVYPRDIMKARTPFAELARWIMYGRRAPVSAPLDPANLIPRIVHIVRFTEDSSKNKDMRFDHFLSMLSALYVGGFERVFLHVNMVPHGRWWDELAGENITVIPIDNFQYVFQQEIRVIQHKSDVARFLILEMYGGAYQDQDVYWVNRVPERILAYPSVISPDYHDGLFPERFNSGVIFSRRHASWLRHVVDSFRYFRDDKWLFNGGQMPYRVFELHPDSVFVDRHMQVLCHRDECFPTWDKHAVNISQGDPRVDKRSLLTEQVGAVHVTMPKPHPALQSPDTVRTGENLIAEVGRRILRKSGRGHLLE